MSQHPDNAAIIKEMTGHFNDKRLHGFPPSVRVYEQIPRLVEVFKLRSDQ
jgi:hypothetical protein